MDAKRATAAGLIGTASMTALLLIEPAIGLPEIAIGQTLTTTMAAVSSHTAVGPLGGWVLDVAVGVVLALVYAAYLEPRLTGAPAVRGLVFGALVFVVAQLVYAPLTGSGVFSGGDPRLLAGALLGHLVYGAVVGYVYGVTPRAAVAVA